MNTQTVSVALASRSYNIQIGTGLLHQAGELIAPVIRRKKVLLVQDAALAGSHGQTLLTQLLNSGFDVATASIPSGETSKSAEQLNHIWDVLAEHRFGRDCALVALGGGVIGDLAGFAAASFLRGIDFVQIPTTLLAMVDSSVGGKTGINHPRGKNLIGAFWQPKLVIADMDTLRTLPRGECVSALAEIIKYGVIADWDFFAWQEANVAALARLGGTALAHAVKRSCEIKAAVVSEDEHETTGRREILNFGHTIGHAIENSAGYGALRHGEAIAVGMIAESQLAVNLGNKWSSTDHERLVSLVAAAGLPTSIPESLTLTVEELLLAARSDKKNRAGTTRYAIPTAPAVMETISLADDAVRAILAAVGAKV